VPKRELLIRQTHSEIGKPLVCLTELQWKAGRFRHVSDIPDSLPREILASSYGDVERSAGDISEKEHVSETTEVNQNEQTDVERITKLLINLPSEKEQETDHNDKYYDIARNIERQRKPCRASIYLKCSPPLPHSNSLYDTRDVAKALQYMMLSFPLQEALVQVTDPEALIDLYNREGGISDVDDRIIDQERLAEALLDQLEIPYQVKPSPLRLRAPSDALDDIRDIEKELQRSHASDTLSLLSWQGGSLSAWSIVESVLKLMLGFVALHLRDALPTKFVRRFEKWRIGSRSGGQIIRTFEDIECFFKNGGTQEPTRSSLEFAKRLQDDWFREFHRGSPFEGVPTKAYQEWYSFERNELAHSPIQDLMAENRDDGILESLRKARALIRDLAKRNVVPRLITVVGDGKDLHGNQILWFTDVSTFSKADSKSMPMEWMFTMTDADWSFLQPFAMLSPAPRTEIIEEPLMEPIMYPLAEIEAIVERGEWCEG